ncbi:energy-coupling factor transporter transmembrane component T [Paenibacillus glufosinatiresistens]|uniref:energy-coupling factor transporter transmembrane component T n=1 Tax=Paenibacillus glufosinatiresistens TaxID=3070657 RepID=UPI00286DAE5F|nr:energy-coupling factor transporter transmembrane component T [Paenibacillus sp. YX.27]
MGLSAFDRRPAQGIRHAGGFRSLHPAVCLLYYAGAAGLAMIMLHPVFLLAGALIAALAAGLLGDGPRLRRALPWYLLMSGAVAIINPLFSHRGRVILFYFRDQPITLEAILYGVTAMLSLLCLLLAFLTFQSVITADKFMYLFGSALPRTALLALMTIRFVPMLTRRLRQITRVQRLKGIDMAQGSWLKRARDGMTLLQVLLNASLEEAMGTADSMKARGYGTVRRRSSYVLYRMDGRDRRALAGLSLLLLFCLGGRAAGLGVLPLYPVLAEKVWRLGDLPLFAGFSLFWLAPVYYELRERLAWTSSKSRT